MHKGLPWAALFSSQCRTKAKARRSCKPRSRRFCPYQPFGQTIERGAVKQVNALHGVEFRRHGARLWLGKVFQSHELISQHSNLLVGLRTQMPKLKIGASTRSCVLDRRLVVGDPTEAITQCIVLEQNLLGVASDWKGIGKLRGHRLRSSGDRRSCNGRQPYARARHQRSNLKTNGSGFFHRTVPKSMRWLLEVVKTKAAVERFSDPLSAACATRPSCPAGI
jgi:hypothetical protein